MLFLKPKAELVGWLTFRHPTTVTRREVHPAHTPTIDGATVLPPLVDAYTETELLRVEQSVFSGQNCAYCVHSMRLRLTRSMIYNS